MYFGGKMTNNPPNPMMMMVSSPDPPVVLDLCVRKRPLSPTYVYDYSSPPPYPDTCLSPRSPFSESSDVSSTENRDFNANVRPGKVPRPFKAFPKDPLSITLLGEDSSGAYTEFRERMLSQVRATSNGTNKNMRRVQQQNRHNVDPSYWEKRKKNNEAAKRSRDARKAKEDEIAIRCAFLEQENLQLKFRLAALESERERLQEVVYRHQ